MAHALTLTDAGRILRAGGVIAYPTEAVWGLGCDPLNKDAVLRLLAIKQREVGKGLILIAAHVDQLKPFLDFSRLTAPQLADVLGSWPGPYTWIMPAAAGAPRWITGDHDGIAVRVSAHVEVARLCNIAGSALVSTSANLSGEPPPRDLAELSPALLAAIDGHIAGETGASERPTTIRDARSGTVLRT